MPCYPLPSSYYFLVPWWHLYFRTQLAIMQAPRSTRVSDEAASMCSAHKQQAATRQQLLPFRSISPEHTLSMHSNHMSSIVNALAGVPESIGICSVLTRCKNGVHPQSVSLCLRQHDLDWHRRWRENEGIIVTHVKFYNRRERVQREKRETCPTSHISLQLEQRMRIHIETRLILWRSEAHVL